MRGSTRLLAALWTLLYLAVVVALPVLHAATEEPHGTAVSHLHSERDADCPPPHDDLHCPSCRVAGQKLATPPAAPALLAEAVRRAPSPLPLRQAHPSASPVRLPGSRAPPLA